MVAVCTKKQLQAQAIQNFVSVVQITVQRQYNMFINKL